MESIAAVAREFCEGCEAGGGWEASRAYCMPDASSSAPAEPVADLRVLQQYADWMKKLLHIRPDGRYVVQSFARSPEIG